MIVLHGRRAGAGADNARATRWLHGGGRPVLVDIHTNLMWYPDHYSEEFVAASWEAKKAKMRLTSDVHCDVDDQSWKHNFDCRPAQLLEATKGCDKAVVFAIDAPFTGINGSQEAVAAFAR